MRKIMKRAMAYILVLALTLTLAPAVLLTASAAGGTWGGGDGSSEATAYLIEDAKDLAELAQQVNAGNNFAGEYFKMTKDIDLAGWIADNDPTEGWTPIGVSNSDLDGATSFQGIFDGNGYAVKNLYINRTADGQGLFGDVYNATIKNLGFVDCDVTGGAYSGGLIGQTYGSTSFPNTISGCYVIGDITSTGRDVGALCGSLYYATVEQCFATGSVTSTGMYVGGLIGYSAGSSIRDCYTNSYVEGGEVVGGVVGNLPFSGTFQRLIAMGNAKATTKCVGGVVGGNGIFMGTISAFVAVGTNVECTDTTQTGRVVGLNTPNGYAYALSTMEVNGSPAASTGAADRNGTDITSANIVDPDFWIGLGFDNTVWSLEQGQLPKLMANLNAQLPDYTLNGADGKWSDGDITMDADGDELIIDTDDSPTEPVEIYISVGDGETVTIQGRDGVVYDNVNIFFRNDSLTNAHSATIKLIDLQITSAHMRYRQSSDPSSTRGSQAGLRVYGKTPATTPALVLDITGNCMLGGSDAADSGSGSYYAGGDGLSSLSDVTIEGSGTLLAQGGNGLVEVSAGKGGMGINLSSYGHLEVNTRIEARAGISFTLLASADAAGLFVANLTANAPVTAYGSENYRETNDVSGAYISAGGSGMYVRYNMIVNNTSVTAYGGDGLNGGIGLYMPGVGLSATPNNATITAHGGTGSVGNGGIGVRFSGTMNIDITGGSVFAAYGGDGAGNGAHGIYLDYADIQVVDGGSATICGGNGGAGVGGVGIRAYNSGTGNTVTIGNDAGDVYIRGGMGASVQRDSIMGGDIYIATGNVGSISHENGAVTPALKNISGGDDLYMLTVYTDPAEATVISSDVTGTLAGTYTYKAPTLVDGVAYMWLPVGEQTVSARDFFDKSGAVNTTNDAVITLTKTRSVSWTGLTANGVSNSTTTTELTLTFDVDPTTLTADDITVTGATKGALTETGTTRTLAISNITVADGSNITVEIANPTGYVITPASRTVVVYKAPSTGGGSPTTYYTVKFDAQGGSAVSDKSVASGGTVAKPSDPTRDDYTFTGWYTDAACSTPYDFTAKVTRSFTLYAGWDESEPDEWRNPFIDVQEDDWFYDDVRYVYENGLMVGTSTTTFEPQTAVSRAMVVTVLWRMEGEPEPQGENPFTDLTQDWYTEAVIWAAENDIVKGYGDGRFGPEDSITREQLAAMLYRYAGWAGLDVSASVDLSGYSDAGSISDWALAAMRWANAEGLITGRSATELAPKGTATRAELAAILHRFLGAALSE